MVTKSIAIFFLIHSQRGIMLWARNLFWKRKRKKKSIKILKLKAECKVAQKKMLETSNIVESFLNYESKACQFFKAFQVFQLCNKNFSIFVLSELANFQGFYYSKDWIIQSRRFYIWRIFGWKTVSGWIYIEPSIYFYFPQSWNIQIKIQKEIFIQIIW